MNPDTLKALREAAGLSRAELGERAGVDTSVLSRVENGQRTNVAVSTLRALARVLADALGRDLGEIMVALTDPQ